MVMHRESLFLRALGYLRQQEVRAPNANYVSPPLELTIAAVPDFRSPGTGLYHNLERLNLPQAEAVFEINYFRQNPVPFYVLAKELYPGKFHPTISHVFIALLAKKGLLRMLFTQNIDTLERRAGVPEELIVEAHGSFATQRCIDCSRTYPDDRMREHVEKADVPHCESCDGLVKPDIVFFGEGLPERFHIKRNEAAMADLVIILGTSLTVHPFAYLPQMCSDDTPRVLFNLERVGGIGSRADDVLAIGECDTGVRRLADALGWREELEDMWVGLVGEKEAILQRARASQGNKDIEEEVGRLTEQVDAVLRVQSDSDTDANEGKSAQVSKENAEKADVSEKGTEGSRKRPKDVSAEAGNDLGMGPETTGHESLGKPDEMVAGQGPNRDDVKPAL
jgi:NAD+-dependent protein deacetylase SIR2